VIVHSLLIGPGRGEGTSVTSTYASTSPWNLGNDVRMALVVALARLEEKAAKEGR
jgi:hypothetical protein